jgi:hypothetical protein
MITTLEAVEFAPRRVRVRVRRYAADYENLDEQVCQRLAARSWPLPQCLYVNPIAQVTCSKPTKEFFDIVRLRQAQWARQSRSTLGAGRRKLKSWASANGVLPKKERFFERARCFTGALYINGRFIAPHRWKDFECPIPDLLPASSARPAD